MRLHGSESGGEANDVISQGIRRERVDKYLLRSFSGVVGSGECLMLG